MLSGHGPEDAVPWDFTIDGGMRASEAARIAVPSNWQQQGFGHYQYGDEKGMHAADHGVYRRHFAIPAAWKGRTIRLVFDAVMTDTLVKVNGVAAGPLHQGGFNRFDFDVTGLVRPGADNAVEVDVSEASAARETDIAERHGDYWAFGGIYRPVWLEASPVEAIAHAAIDARANGDIAADVTLAAPRTVTRIEGRVRTLAGEPVGRPFAVPIPAGGTGRLRLAGHVDAPALWSAETPNLYALDLTLFRGDEAVHRLRRRFGFRTFELREGQGLFLNGRRILLKGVNRHSFRADTGRALSRADAYDDVRTIRAMNMNAVRMSHYSPEESLLDAADELGLYVLDELSGWQHAHGTEVGRKLVRALVERDVDHPSILFWDNGNEGGWNRELDGDFALYDPQHRPVLHPWELHDGIDTKHYPRYPDLVRRLAGNDLVMPTEFLHGLFDGGSGAGLDDYWRAIAASPRGAGGFLWSYADEGIARTDQGGRIDTYATYAPDGILGPRHEKEPSYFTIREIWSPVQIAEPTIDAKFDGVLRVTNAYDFTPLSDVRFSWSWLRFARPQDRDARPTIVASGASAGGAIAPHATGTLVVSRPPAGVRADALSVTARRGDETLMRWTWPIAAADAPPRPASGRQATPRVIRDGGSIRLVAGPLRIRFDAATGLLQRVERGGAAFDLANGPRLVAARPKSKAEPLWTSPVAEADGTYRLPAPAWADIAEVDLGLGNDDGWAGFTLDVSPDGRRWKTVHAGARTARDGRSYTFPPQRIVAVRVSNLSGSRAVPRVKSLRLGYEPDRFGREDPRPVVVATGAGRDPATGRAVAWLDAPGAGGLDRARWTLSDDGALTLDYAYRLTGSYLYHGIGFDQPPAAVRSVRALVRGPWPVWQNRLRGPMLGVHDIAGRGSGAPDPATAGYFAGLRWARFETEGGRWTVRSRDPVPYLQLGARLADLPTTTVEFPASDVGFLQAIPAMGAKFQTADLTGPAGEPATAAGTYRGTLVFDWTPR